MMFLFKHKFDLKHPEITKTWRNVAGLKLRGIDYAKYHCKNCDYIYYPSEYDTYSAVRVLDGINNLPKSIKYGCKRRLITWDFMHDHFWIRIFGRGISLFSFPPLFSERYGYQKVLRIGKYGIELLK